MNRNIFWVGKKVLAAVILTLTVILVLAIGTEATAFKNVYTFTGGTDGSIPASTLVFDGISTLYGTTIRGGAYGFGVVFSVTRNSDGSLTEKVIYDFTGGEDGSIPYSPLIFDPAGNLYGTTEFGGTGACSYNGYSGCGTVFELSPNLDGSWSETVLYSFTGVLDGAFPAFGALTFDRTGNLYGATLDGGNISENCAYGCGTVFELIPASDRSWNESVLYRFDEPHGWAPVGDLVFDKAGRIYGITNHGGGDRGPNCPAYPGCGTVYKLTPNLDGSWSQSILHYFLGQLNGDGGIAYSGMTLGPDGDLYGTTAWGAGPGYGGIFKLNRTGSGFGNYQWIYNFGSGTDGAVPYGRLTLDTKRQLIYGTTYEGGTGPCQNFSGGCGTVFSLTQGSSGYTVTVLYSFQNHPASYPTAGVIVVSGYLFGAARGDSISTFGTVFGIRP
jgi:uncharacterized repeat protein (TIGR03803 family)